MGEGRHVTCSVMFISCGSRSHVMFVVVVVLLHRNACNCGLDSSGRVRRRLYVAAHCSYLISFLHLGAFGVLHHVYRLFTDEGGLRVSAVTAQNGPATSYELHSLHDFLKLHQFISRTAEFKDKTHHFGNQLMQNNYPVASISKRRQAFCKQKLFGPSILQMMQAR